MDVPTNPPAPTAKRKPREWAPRMWLGCDFYAWLRLVSKGHFDFHMRYMHIGVVATAVTFGHTLLKYAQQAIYGKKIRATKIEQPPVFIIGHWRTGTTLLHELLIQDPRHNYPNNYQCLDPNHFLLSEKYFKQWFWFLLPDRRPMDNMTLGWDRPQEDEFALCMLGQPSPYLDIAFPNRPSIAPGSLDLEGLTPQQCKEWKKTFYRFVQTLTLKDPRRLILKSPPHSCRIPTLLELFPDARFIHIVRNPYDVFPSTVNLWKSLANKHGLQTPTHAGLEERVYSTFIHMYDRIGSGKKLIAPSRFHEIKYEDLIRNPFEEMRLIYERLDLGDFENLRPHMERYFQETAGYERNKFQLTSAQKLEINRRWGDVIRQYGYAIEPSEHFPEPGPSFEGKDTEERIVLHSDRANGKVHAPGVIPMGVPHARAS